jgi:hypothetical protein
MFARNAIDRTGAQAEHNAEKAAATIDGVQR